jgi:cytochrome b subunit of formate dehydrogenase
VTARVMNAADRGEGPYVRRFSPLYQVLHVLVIVSFLGLVATGLPLRFAYAAWAPRLMALFGGPVAAGLIHRACALITFGYFFVHLGDLLYRSVRKGEARRLLWGPDSMVPQPKDARDVIQMFKWFFGKAPHPRFERFSYMEKFDYWAVFWGVAIIGSSGLLLWFPTFFARFMPGWVFNIATIIHGDEALLAASFIFTIHFFNVHFRPEKFPIDTVIFTGRATTEYMKEEHGLEYERVDREGGSTSRIAPPPSRVAYLWSVVFGFSALAVGIVLIVLVIAVLFT